ncbi:MAG TPA: YbhB/YbcL family Raf kinase inhibitor-like protein [Stellaceae bacterium]|nr:YbhB/YbcL family Raf kinase inhibitor-like protein [Stellaceae bacterium]
MHCCWQWRLRRPQRLLSRSSSWPRPTSRAAAPWRRRKCLTVSAAPGNISLALSWSGEPAGTQSFAIMMFDSDARAGSGWWHWTVFNIPASVHSLPAGVGSDASKDLPTGAVQGRNDFGFSFYGGPCPPVGEHAHHYEITVYALKVPKLDLDASAPGAKVGSELRANALESAMIAGRYERAK